MQLLGFHANLNKEISQIDPGIYKQDITAPENGLFAFTEPSAKLAIGDTLHYWLFVQKSFLGYRKLGKLTVTSKYFYIHDDLIYYFFHITTNFYNTGYNNLINN